MSGSSSPTNRSGAASAGGKGIARVEPTLQRSQQASKPGDPQDAASGALIELRACLDGLNDAMRIEGIEPHGVLGVWCRAMRAGLLAFCCAVDLSTARVEGRSEIIEGAMREEVNRVRVAVEESRAETVRARISTAHSEEVRKVENLKLARELGEGIKETLKTTMLAREIRFNRRQNWSAVSLVALAAFACFIGGGVWSGYRSDHGVIGRCLAKQVPDESGQHFYCSMDVVRGGS